MSKKVRILLTTVLSVLVVALIGTGVLYVTTENKSLTEPEETQLPEETEEPLIIDPERFIEGVKISGVDVSGMTLAEARRAVTPISDELISEFNYTFTYTKEAKNTQPAAAANLSAVNPSTRGFVALAAKSAVAEQKEEEKEETNEVPANEEPLLGAADPEMVIAPAPVQPEVINETPAMDAVGVSCNEAYILQEAFNLGHDDTMSEEELQALARDVKENGREFEIALELNEEDAMNGIIAALAEMIDVEAQDATVQINKEAENPEDIFSFTNAVTGYAVDKQALLDTLKEKIESKEYAAEIEIPVNVTEPKIQDGAPTTDIVLRSKAYTAYDHSPYNRSERVYNIKKAVGFVNGTVVAPGQTFSMNDTIGPRTYSLGWKPAPAIVDGGASEDQAGGGVCQVSTTLYNAVVMADLEVVYRQGHSSKLGYVDGGLDATINTGTIDFKWKNNTNSDIYIIMYTTDEKKVFCEIYGEAFTGDFDEIRLTSKKLETLKPKGEIEYRVDSSKSASYKETYAKRKDGSRWQSYKNYYKNGELIRTEKLDVTTYPARNGIIIVGKGAETSSPKPSSSGSSTPKPSSSGSSTPPTPSKDEPTPSKDEPTPPPEDTPVG